MSDEDIVQAAVHEWQQGHPISDGQARVIANQWHGGQVTALCTLSTTGAIRLDDVRGEIEAEMARLTDLPEREEIEALLGYVERHGERGPVEGWSRLWG